MAKSTKGKATHGGPGRGQGRKNKYGEKTKPVTYRVPETKEPEFRQGAEAILKKWETKKAAKKKNNP